MPKLFAPSGLAVLVSLLCSCSATLPSGLSHESRSPEASDSSPRSEESWEESWTDEASESSASEDKLVGDGVEGSLRASLRGVMKNYNEGSPGSNAGEMRFMVCSTDYDYERKITISTCSQVTP
jgi:hypothetical protein